MEELTNLNALKDAEVMFRAYYGDTHANLVVQAIEEIKYFRKFRDDSQAENTRLVEQRRAVQAELDLYKKIVGECESSQIVSEIDHYIIMLKNEHPLDISLGTRNEALIIFFEDIKAKIIELEAKHEFLTQLNIKWEEELTGKNYEQYLIDSATNVHKENDELRKRIQTLVKELCKESHKNGMLSMRVELLQKKYEDLRRING